MEPVLVALAWLYLYSVLWLTAYAVLAVLALGWSPILITGGSMQPHIAPGDLVMVSPLAERVGKGTVVTYRQPGRGRLVTHRVVDVLPDGYRTRGDANAVPDSDLVPDAAVRGAGRLLVPLVGRPLVWGRNGDVVPLTAWALVTTAALALVLRRPDEAGEGAAVDEAAPALPAQPRATWAVAHG